MVRKYPGRVALGSGPISDEVNATTSGGGEAKESHDSYPRFYTSSFKLRTWRTGSTVQTVSACHCFAAGRFSANRAASNPVSFFERNLPGLERPP